MRVTDPGDEAAGLSFRGWEQWHQNVALMTLRRTRCPIAALIVKYLCRIQQEDRYHRLVVLIPEVLCWLRYRSDRFARCGVAAAAPR